MLRFLSLALIAACDPRVAHEDPIDAAGAEVLPIPTPALIEGSTDHGDALAAARDAVQAAEVPVALEHLAPWLAPRVAADVPPELRVYVHGIAEELGGIDEVRGLEDAGRAIGAAAARCGRCHSAAGVSPPADVTPPTVHPYRQLAGLAWDALVWPDGPAWSQLTATLAPSADEAMPEDATAPLVALARPLRDAPGGAATTLATSRRIEVFARVQASCEACHAEPVAPAVEGTLARQ